jgi:hypothetical protein
MEQSRRGGAERKAVNSIAFFMTVIYDYCTVHSKRFSFNGCRTWNNSSPFLRYFQTRMKPVRTAVPENRNVAGQKKKNTLRLFGRRETANSLSMGGGFLFFFLFYAVHVPDAETRKMSNGTRRPWGSFGREREGNVVDSHCDQAGRQNGRPNAVEVNERAD